MADNLSPEMEKVLSQAKAYGDWFSIQHHPDAPVIARHQTVKALFRRGLLERVEITRYRADMPITARVDVQYRFKQS